MHLYEFDRSVAFHNTNAGSDFFIAPFTAPSASNMRVHFFHLDPGGFVGRHPTGVRQAFCVVDGEGWVTGDDDVRVGIRKGQAALWLEGETHAAGTDSGLTAVVV